MVQNLIRSAIIGDSGINALIGGRVWAIVLPEEAVLPAVTLVFRSFGGFQAYKDGTLSLRRGKIEISSWARGDAFTPSAAHSVASIGDMIENLINGRTTLSGDGVEIQNIVLDIADTMYEYETNLLRDFRSYDVVWRNL